ncbi:hypothetical protein, partial [Streptomyces sp. NPDC089795]|uniref:hypothetical protein n=1 Tax=Streptomyces sp. NPDC089795 TaxID=3155297 RepID=UPI003412BDB7
MVLLLVLLLPAVSLLALGLLGRGLATLGRRGWLRPTAALLGACAAGVYAWGLLHVAGAVIAAADGGAGSSPPAPCRTPGLEERAAHVTDYGVDYVPLRFVCRTTGGGGYAAAADSAGPTSVRSRSTGRTPPSTTCSATACTRAP